MSKKYTEVVLLQKNDSWSTEKAKESGKIAAEVAKKFNKTNLKISIFPTKNQLLETLEILSTLRLNREKNIKQTVDSYIKNIIALQTYEDLKKRYSNG